MNWANLVGEPCYFRAKTRLCVDMRCANKAILRERLPIPTVDEVLEELNGCTVLSKLDLNLGFHQSFKKIQEILPHSLSETAFNAFI